MTIEVSAETQKLLEEKMQLHGFSSADEAVRCALEQFDQPIDVEIDAETQAALDRAEEQIERGEVRDWKEVSAELRKRYLGQ
jgi:hypothetical protein